MTNGRALLPESLHNEVRCCLWSLTANAAGKATKRPDRSTRAGAATLMWQQVAHTSCGPKGGVGVVTTGRCVKQNWGLDYVLLWLDMDACIDPQSGAVSPWADRLLDTLQTWCYLTPSGTGLRAVVWFPAYMLPANPRTIRRIPAEPPPGVTKTPEVQIFGTGPAGYVTLGTTVVEDRPVRFLDADTAAWFVTEFELETAPGDAVEFPISTAPRPAVTEVVELVRRHAAGAELLDGQWSGRYPSASEGYFRLATLVLRAANGHGDLAVEALLETPWGRGDVDDSRDPARYARAAWVEREVARIAGKTNAGLDPSRIFDALEPMPDAKSPAPAPAPVLPVSPIRVEAARRWRDDLWVEPPRARDFLLLRPDAESAEAGFAPTGVTGFLSSEGGVGKTMLLLQLACAIATGRDWLGFRVAPRHRGGTSLLVLAEETREEVERRLWALASANSFTLEERAAIARRVVVLPLAGHPVPLARLVEGVPSSTPHFDALEQVLTVPPDGAEHWSVVALDPLARLFPQAESDNELGTYAIQLIERVVAGAPGNPLGLVSHHSSKMARRAGAVDARGVTALTDGARLAWTIQHKSAGRVEFAQPKSNYTAGTEPFTLLRGPGGSLRRSTGQDEQEDEQTRASARVEAVDRDAVKVFRTLEARGPCGSQSVLRAWLGVSLERTRVALARACDLGWVAAEGLTRGKTYRAVQDPDVGQAVLVVEATPVEERDTAASC